MECNCKVCSERADWICTDYEFYCDKHAPINKFQKFIGYLCSYLLWIAVTLNPKAYGR